MCITEDTTKNLFSSFVFSQKRKNKGCNLNPKYGIIQFQNTPWSRIIRIHKVWKGMKCFSPKPREHFHFFHLVLLRLGDDYLSTRRFEFPWHINEEAQHLASRSVTHECQSPFVCQCWRLFILPIKTAKDNNLKNKNFELLIGTFELILNLPSIH